MTRYFGLGSGKPKCWRHGNELRRDEQGLVLMAWEAHRYTLDKQPDWVTQEAARGRLYPPQFVNDVDWLEHTRFAVTMNGNLDKRSKECREEPTWPTEPVWRVMPRIVQAQIAPNLRYPGWAQACQATLIAMRAEYEADPVKFASKINQDLTDAGIPIPDDGVDVERILGVKTWGQDL